MEYLAVISYPHEYTSTYTLNFSSEEGFRKWLLGLPDTGRRFGQTGYERVELYKLVEVVR